MNKEKYKSVIINKELHELLTNLAEKEDRTIVGTMKRLVKLGLDAECEYANLDCELITGGTPRLRRLLEDLRWYKANSSITPNLKYIINNEEARAIDTVIEALSDTIE